MEHSHTTDSRSRTPPAPARYRIDGLCGSGGSGRVYRAWDSELGRAVALKFLHDDRPEHRARMLRESRAQARIDHANVCHIFDVGEEGERLYIAMQWIDGEQLGVLSPLLTLEEKIGVLRDVADGVQAAHAEGVIHRDLKPANILVERREDGSLHPYVVDFGLARSIEDVGTTATGEIIGTPQYLSPEQAWGLPADRRSDVYALGATLYELLSGAPPYSGATPTDVIMQIISRPARPLQRVAKSVPRDLAIIAGTCLEKEPERRYDSARALRADLARWLAGEPITARAPGLMYRAHSLLRRHRALAAAIVLATLITGAVGGYQISRLHKERAVAEVTARLEDRVRYIERLLDHDRALPLHDTRSAVARAEGEIATLASGIPPQFSAAVAYAEGRARLAAGDAALALELLERSWNSGLREPSVAYYYAAASIEEYARGLSDAERIPSEQLRRARIADLQKRYRAAVIPLLGIARASIEHPSALVEARIAFIDGDDARTTSLTDAVIARYPWNNEARMLQAEAHVRSARALRLAGSVGEATGSFERARRVYKQAAIIAPSDPRILDGLCQIAAAHMQIAGPFSTQIPADFDARFSEARASCEQALVADPDLVSAWIALSSAWSLLAFRSGSSTDHENALKAVEKAVEIAPDDPAVLVQAGLTHWRMGAGHGTRAERLLRRAVALDPRSLEARHSLGRALLQRYDEMKLTGNDPRPVLGEAAEHYREIVRVAPDYIGAFNNLAIVLYHLGTEASLRGSDPEPFHLEAVTILESLIARIPALAEPRSVCAWNLYAIAELRSSKGADVSGSLTRALGHLDEAIRLNSDFPIDYGWRARVRLLEARLAPDGVTRSRVLALARQDLESFDAVVRGSSGSELIREEWYRLMAMHEPHDGRAIRYLDQGDDELERFITNYPLPSARAWLMRGRIQRIRWRRSLDERDLIRSEEYFKRALELEPLLRREVERARAELRNAGEGSLLARSTSE